MLKWQLYEGNYKIAYKTAIEAIKSKNFKISNIFAEELYQKNTKDMNILKVNLLTAINGNGFLIKLKKNPTTNIYGYFWIKSIEHC